MSAVRLSPGRQENRKEVLRSLQASRVTVEPLHVSENPVSQASLRFRVHMKREGVTTGELLRNLDRVKRDLAAERQNR